MATIAVLGTFDTKGVELGFVADVIRSRGHAVMLIDVGTLRRFTQITADISASKSPPPQASTSPN